MLWMHGGPTHLDMFDLKPDAPAEIRGDFEPVRTTVAGAQFSQHMTKIAAMADKFSFIRSNRHNGDSQLQGEAMDSVLQEFTDTAIDFTEIHSGLRHPH